ncbi:hypothetical protein ACVIGA_002802 [Bradyrhizobium sp. USDA 3240]
MGLETLGHEQAERIRRVLPERRTLPVAGGAIEPDRLRLPNSGLQGAIFRSRAASSSVSSRRRPSPSPHASARTNIRFISACSGAMRRKAIDPSTSPSRRATRKTVSRGGPRLDGGEVIAVRRVQHLHVGVRQIDQLPHIGLPRVFGGDADVRLAHL